MFALFRRIFTYPDWGVAFREVHQDDPLPKHGAKTEYVNIPIKPWTYIADPFLFDYKGDVYLFVEKMSRNRGIGEEAVAKYDPKNKCFLPFQTVISESFHMSYPNVFQYEEEIYMLPEMNQSKQVALYRAVEFPTRWVKDTVLLDHVCLVDCSFFQENDGSLLVFAHDHTQATNKYLFQLNMKEKKLIPLSIEHYPICVGRGGGNVLKIQGKFYRPIQDCSHVYGEKLVVTAIDRQNGCFREQIQTEIAPEDVRVKGVRSKLHCLHTINRCNRLEAIDYRINRFYLWKPFRAMLIRSRR